MTVFSVRTAASSDDAYQQNATMNLTGALNCSGPTQYMGLRFLGITIPAGSTIDVCYITLNLPSGSFDDPNVVFWGELAASPGTYTTTDNDITDRTKTTNNVAWSGSGLGTGTENSPSLVAIMQEIIDQGGWGSGNAAAIMLYGNTGSALRVTSYDNDPALCPLLYVEYTAPSGGSTRQRKRHLAQGMRMGSELGF